MDIDAQLIAAAFGQDELLRGTFTAAELRERFRRLSQMPWQTLGYCSKFLPLCPRAYNKRRHLSEKRRWWRHMRRDHKAIVARITFPTGYVAVLRQGAPRREDCQ